MPPSLDKVLGSNPGLVIYFPRSPDQVILTPHCSLQSCTSQAASESVADDEEFQPSLDDDMEEVQFAGAVSTSDHTTTDRPFKQMILSIGKRLH